MKKVSYQYHHLWFFYSRLDQTETNWGFRLTFTSRAIQSFEGGKRKKKCVFTFILAPPNAFRPLKVAGIHKVLMQCQTARTEAESLHFIFIMTYNYYYYYSLWPMRTKVLLLVSKCFWKLLTHTTTTPYPVSATAQTSADRNVEIPDHLHAKWSLRRPVGRMWGPLLNTANHACQKKCMQSPEKYRLT